MEFKINDDKKEKIGAILGGQKKSVRIVKKIGRIFLVMGFVGATIYGTLNLINKDWSMTISGGYWHKDYIGIVSNIMLIITEAAFLWMCCYFLRLNLASANVLERVDEELSLEDGNLIYLFRVQNQSWENDRILWRFKLKDMSDVKLDSTTNKLIITGKMDAKYLELMKEEEEVTLDSDKVIEAEAIIHDYFEPSLIETLRNKGVQIEEI